MMHDEWHEFEIAVHLAFLSEQKLTRLEMFEVDRVADAVSRFRSLTAATNSSLRCSSEPQRGDALAVPSARSGML